MRRSNWSAEDDAALTRAYRPGISPAELAKVVNRSPSAVTNRLAALGIRVNNRWSASEDETAIQMVKSGASNEQIGAAVGRNARSVRDRLSKLRSDGRLAKTGRGSRPGPPRIRYRPGHIARPCLHCKKTFKSQGAHNRYCDGCRYKLGRRVSDWTVAA